MIRRSQLKARLPELIIEVISIVLAVLLALAVNQWREARKTDKLVSAAEQQILGELWRNRRVLEIQLPDHQAMLEVLQQGAPPAAADDAAESGSGLRYNPVFLRSSAWQAAFATGAVSEMSYDRVSSLSEIYAYQEAYTDVTRAVINASMNQLGRRLDEGSPEQRAAYYRDAAQLVGTLVLMERGLLRVLVAYLEGDGSYASLIEVLRSGPDSEVSPGGGPPPASGAEKP